jgi:hypothetical protein
MAEMVGYSLSLFEHPAIFSATCMKSDYRGKASSSALRSRKAEMLMD